MSRVGKKPISIPSGVTVNISDTALEVKGPKGSLTTPVPAGVKFRQEDGSLIAERENDDQAAFHGLARALANNAVVGVTEVHGQRTANDRLDAVTRKLFGKFQSAEHVVGVCQRKRRLMVGLGKFREARNRERTFQQRKRRVHVQVHEIEASHR